MRNKAYIPLIVFLLLCRGLFSQEGPKEIEYRIPAGENSWKDSENTLIHKDGITHSANSPLKIRSYFHMDKPGKINLGIKAKALKKPAKLKLTLEGKSVDIIIKDPEFHYYYVDTFNLAKPGYHELILETLGHHQLEIEEYILNGTSKIHFTKGNFHFGRRGPSVHLRYPIPPESKKPVYFYNEILVPEGDDVIGSYYMANGFVHGYFGIQVNSNRERRILFSVWSPYHTQDPSEIPKDQKIILLDKGQDVYSGEFGNEGSGGQSYKKYMWKAGTTYKFLLKGEPWGEKHTDYSAYFYVPEKNGWELIASFRRPKSSTYLKNLYSFLENFVPETGDITRKALYKNQWIYDLDHGWIEITDAIFTADATANKRDRLDYAGWKEEEGYFLKNCGFFNDYTELNSKFKRDRSISAPQIDFKKLEK